MKDTLDGADKKVSLERNKRRIYGKIADE